MRATPLNPVTKEELPLAPRTAVRRVLPVTSAAPRPATPAAAAPIGKGINLAAMSVDDHQFIKFASETPEVRAERCRAAAVTALELNEMVNADGQIQKDAFSDKHAPALRRLCLVHRLEHCRHQARTVDGLVQRSRNWRSVIDFHDRVRTRFAQHRREFGQEPVAVSSTTADEHED